jgi:hypothetical protein
LAPAAAGASLLALAPALAGMELGGWLRARVRPVAFRLCFFVGLLALEAELVWRGWRDRAVGHAKCGGIAARDGLARARRTPLSRGRGAALGRASVASAPRPRLSTIIEHCGLGGA